jgi:hypothetical protein
MYDLKKGTKSRHYFNNSWIFPQKINKPSITIQKCKQTLLLEFFPTDDDHTFY